MAIHRNRCLGNTNDGWKRGDHFVALREQISDVRSLEWGTDVSPEGLAKGFTHAFLLSFDDAAARDAYLPHPAHQAFVAQLQPLLDDVLVIDYFANA